MADATAAESPASGTTSPGRRQVLRRLAVPPTVAALAGCSSAGEEPDDPIVEDLAPGDTTGYPGAMRFGDRYAMEVTEGGDGTRRLSGRFHGEDRVVEFADDAGNAVRSYVVDGDGYVVTGGECVAYPGLAAGLESVSGVDPSSVPDGASDPELAVTGRTTVDGSEMLVLERSSGESNEGQPAVSYYVDAETRYLRRIETGTTVVDYHSWDAVDPIEAPDVDCRQSG